MGSLDAIDTLRGACEAATTLQAASFAPFGHQTSLPSESSAASAHERTMAPLQRMVRLAKCRRRWIIGMCGFWLSRPGLARGTQRPDASTPSRHPGCFEQFPKGALLKFEWVKLARGRLAQELGTGGTWLQSPLRPAGPVGVELARKRAFMRVVEAFETRPSGQYTSDQRSPGHRASLDILFPPGLPAPRLPTRNSTEPLRDSSSETSRNPPRTSAVDR